MRTVRVRTNSIKNYVAAVEKCLAEGDVSVYAAGKAINKAVSVVEIVKRKTTVRQSCEIGRSSDADYILISLRPT